MLKNKYFDVVWNVPQCVKALVTTRIGGVGDGSFGKFNLAHHVGDEQSTVLQNRTRLNLDLPGFPHWLNQVHSNLVLDLDNTPDNLTIPSYDASLTRKHSTVCIVMTADCLPILLTDIKASFVAAVHAGWRGLHNNIITNAVQQSNSISCEIIAYIGPAICSKHYEVGPDVFNLFMQKDPANSQYFLKKNESKFECDLVGIATLQLQKLGVPRQQISVSNQCTYCNSELFYSFRKENKTGRFASLIWLAK